MILLRFSLTVKLIELERVFGWTSINKSLQNDHFWGNHDHGICLPVAVFSNSLAKRVKYVLHQ